MTITDFILIAIIGLAAGTLGGLAGIGGSLVMIPGLGIVFGYADDSAHHVYMAAAMCVNVAVALPAALRHHQAKAVRIDLVRVLLPVMAIAIVLGVLLSNMDSGRNLRWLLAAFIAGYALLTLFRFFLKRAEPEPGQERRWRWLLAVIGAGTGLISGVLGIGGGIVLVPLLQLACRVPLRHAIGTSSAVMVLTATVGSILKVTTLHDVGRRPGEALLFAFVMAPTAIVGSRLGAAMTHRLPLQSVRAAIAVLLLIAAARLAGLFG